MYIGTIRAAPERRGMGVRGAEAPGPGRFRCVAMERLSAAHPALVVSLGERAVVPQRHFMLRPTRPGAAAGVGRGGGRSHPAGAAVHSRTASTTQAINWLSTFMPVSDTQRNEVRLLVGESHLGARDLELAIEELGEVAVGGPLECAGLEAPRAVPLAQRRSRRTPRASIGRCSTFVRAMPKRTCSSATSTPSGLMSSCRKRRSRWRSRPTSTT